MEGLGLGLGSPRPSAPRTCHDPTVQRPLPCAAFPSRRLMKPSCCCPVRPAPGLSPLGVWVSPVPASLCAPHTHFLLAGPRGAAWLLQEAQAQEHTGPGCRQELALCTQAWGSAGDSRGAGLLQMARGTALPQRPPSFPDVWCCRLGSLPHRGQDLPGRRQQSQLRRGNATAERLLHHQLGHL